MFYAQIDGTLTIAGTDYEHAAAAVAAQLASLVGADAVTVTVGRPGIATVDLAHSGDLDDSYREELATIAADSRVSGAVTVIDEHANATKHILRGGAVTDHAGRIFYADGKLVDMDLVTKTICAAIDEIDEQAGLSDTGTIDALNLLVNVVVHRLTEDPDASLEAVVEASYGSEEVTEDEDMSPAQVVLSWIS